MRYYYYKQQRLKVSHGTRYGRHSLPTAARLPPWSFRKQLQWLHAVFGKSPRTPAHLVHISLCCWKIWYNFLCSIVALKIVVDASIVQSWSTYASECGLNTRQTRHQSTTCMWSTTLDYLIELMRLLPDWTKCAIFSQWIRYYVNWWRSIHVACNLLFILRISCKMLCLM